MLVAVCSVNDEASLWPEGVLNYLIVTVVKGSVQYISVYIIINGHAFLYLRFCSCWF